MHIQLNTGGVQGTGTQLHNSFLEQLLSGLRISHEQVQSVPEVGCHVST